MAKQEANPEETATAEINVKALEGKFQCTHALNESEGISANVRALLHPVSGESLDGSGTGNESWSIGKPDGVISLAVTTEDMQTFFEAGKHYKVTITPIDPSEPPLDLKN